MILTLTAAATFACAPISVYDGDTLTCSSEVRVRLAAVDAPEMRKCRRGRVCAPGDPVASRNALSRLALGKTLQCRKTGTSYNRIVAWCRAGTIDLSCAQYRGRYAVHAVQYDRRRELCR